MGWIGITDKSGGRFLQTGQGDTNALDRLMPRGTLVLETRLSPDTSPRTLFAFRHTYPWPGGLSLRVMPNGGIVLIEAQGDDLRHSTLPHVTNTQIETVRLSYCWDARRGWARLTLEQLDTDTVRSLDLHAPRPLPVSELRAAIKDPRRRELDPLVNFAAISTAIEPVGPMPGLTGRTHVLTAHGEVPANRIKRGDMIKTARGNLVPVLQAVQRTVPARGSFRPVRLRAPYFGLQRDVVVAPQQKLVMSGTQVEYMFGKEAVLVPALQLVNGVSAHYAQGPDLVTYRGLLLPDHETVLASGCPIESLFVGRLRRKPDQLSTSVLAGFDASRLPEHSEPVWRILKPYEAYALA